MAPERKAAAKKLLTPAAEFPNVESLATESPSGILALPHATAKTSEGPPRRRASG